MHEKKRKYLSLSGKKRILFLLIVVLCVGLNACSPKADAAIFENQRQETERSGIEAETAPALTDEFVSEKASADSETGTTGDILYIYVCGQVNHPGVYQMKQGERVYQAIEKAGGCLETAAADYINQAEPLYDGQQIRIPTQEEIEEMDYPWAPRAEGEQSTESTGLVNINEADAAGLTVLPGIGSAKASAVIAYRDQNGPFGSIEEIKQVEGIKDGTYHKICDLITVE